MVQTLNLGHPSFAATNPVSRNEEFFFTLHYKKHQKCDASQGPQMFGNSYPSRGATAPQDSVRRVFCSLLSKLFWFNAMVLVTTFLLHKSNHNYMDISTQVMKQVCNFLSSTTPLQGGFSLRLLVDLANLVPNYMKTLHYIWCSYGVWSDLGILMLGV